MVSSSPLTRSSHHAGEDFARLKAARAGRESAPLDSMPQFSTKRRVRHSAADMFDLVADVERYPEFVPLCQRPEGAPAHAGRRRASRSIVADMTVAYKLMRETFRSRVTLDRPKLQILVEYLEGPFSHMQNRWTFTPDWRRGLRGRVLHRLRVPQPHARHADGRDVRRGVPPLRRGLRARADRSTGARPPKLFGCALCRPARCSIASASSTERRRTSARPISPKRRSRWIRRPLRAAAAKCTSPTGFSAVPPPGPAMPVIDTARSTGECASAPCAIASAVSRLTAPYCVAASRPARRASAAWPRWSR